MRCEIIAIGTELLLGQIVDIAMPDEDGTGQPPPGDA